MYTSPINVKLSDHFSVIEAVEFDIEQYEKGRNDRDSEIVRCKDCVNWDASWEPSAKGCHYCAITDLITKPDWFCADGERREDEAD